MKRLAVCFALSCLLCACGPSTIELLDTYERDELLTVHHNTDNGCTLLIYRDPMGQTRHVLRRKGIFEFGLTYRKDGDIVLKERGRGPRVIPVLEVSRITQHINALMSVGEQHKEVLSSI